MMSDDPKRATAQQERLPEALERDIAAPAIPVEPADPMDKINDAFNEEPRGSNADNTAVDSMGDIHSGSAVPDPIGDTLEGETEAESLDYFQPDILDEDPVLGSPEGVGNRPLDQEFIDRVADEDENVLDRLDQSEAERNP
jgi:hypothetical protein